MDQTTFTAYRFAYAGKEPQTPLQSLNQEYADLGAVLLFTVDPNRSKAAERLLKANGVDPEDCTVQTVVVGVVGQRPFQKAERRQIHLTPNQLACLLDVYVTAKTYDRAPGDVKRLYKLGLIEPAVVTSSAIVKDDSPNPDLHSSREWRVTQDGHELMEHVTNPTI